MYAKNITGDTSYFRQQYRSLDTEEIVRLKAGGLTAAAMLAADEVLAERSISANIEQEAVETLEAEGQLAGVWASGRKHTSGPLIRFPLRAFLGLEALWKVYWVAGFVVNSYIGFVRATFQAGSLASMLAAAVGLSALMWWVLAVWRCAYNVSPTLAFLGAVVRGLIAGQVLLMLLVGAFAAFK